MTAVEVLLPQEPERSLEETYLKSPSEDSRAAQITSEPTQGNDDNLDDFPDGGFRAYLMLAGGVCISAATFGNANAWGAFQSYYELTLLPNTSSASIAWIGSMQYGLTFLPSLFIGRLFDLGYHLGPLIAASLMLVLATVLTAHCKEFWHFFLCQGLLVGIGSGIAFGSVVPVISHWFKQRRALALGIVGVGSSTGGTVIPIVFRRLLPHVGFQWAMRIIALILLGILALPVMTMRRRLPPRGVQGQTFNLRPFLQPALFLYTIASFICFLGLWTVLTFIDVSAINHGIAEEFSFYLVSIINASAAVGRISAGFLSDRFGALTIFIPLNILTGILSFIWPYARTKAHFIVVGAIYAIGAGTFGAIQSAPVTLLGDIDDVGQRVGQYLAVVAIGSLAGPPISGAIYTKTRGFEAVGAWAGTCLVLGSALMLWSRFLVLRGWRGKF